MELKPPAQAPEKNKTRSPEKPLSGSTRLMLLVSTTALIMLFYIVAVASLLLLGALLAGSISLVLVVARFGLAWFMVRSVPVITRIIMLICRSFKLDYGPEYFIKVPRIAAPKLYEITEILAQKIGVTRPEEIVFEMNNNAYVRLEGYRTGKGKCLLSIGYDFIAALSVDEIEAIIAHELAHAKMVQRGHVKLLAGGLNRVCNLAVALEVMANGDGTGRGSLLARMLTWVIHPLGRTASRLFATYSRQDEFAADRVAAEICGTAVFQSMLLNISIIGYKAHELNWRDRLVHYHREKSFSDWLRSRLLPESDKERAEIEEKVLSYEEVGDYDSHPLLQDRIAVFGDVSEPPAHSEAAITLLADPDDVAQRLIQEVERVVNQEEQRETEELRKRVKGNTGQKKISNAQVIGVLVILVGIPFGYVQVYYSPQKLLYGLMFFGIPLAVGLYLILKCPKRETMLLPAPLYNRWAETNEPELRLWDSEMDSLLADVQRELQQALPAGLSKRDAARHWATVAYNALADCDYLRAWVASDFCLQASPEYMEGLLSRAVAAAYYNNGNEAHRCVNLAFEKNNLGPSLSWGLGWTFSLLESWEAAEAYLLDAVARRPEAPTILSVLAACQVRRGKVHEAIQSARRAVALPGCTGRSRILLARCLLYAGNPKGAMNELQGINQEALDTYDGLLTQAHANLLLGNNEQADMFVQRMLSEHQGPKTILALGGLYHDAEDEDNARRYWTEASQLAYYPDALLGLAMLDHKEDNKDSARAHLLDALDLTQKPGPSGRGTVELMPKILEWLTSLNDPERCMAWTVRLDLTDVTRQIDHVNLLVAAPDPISAKDHIRQLYKAMQPNADADSLDPSLQFLPSDQQPQSSIPRGIHNIWLDGTE